MDTNPINDTSEFTKTNWITFSVIATLIVLSLSFIFLKTEKYIFKTPLSEELAEIKNTSFQIAPQSLAKSIMNKDKSIVLVDVRNQFDFAKGHLPEAKNIYAVNLINDENIDFFMNLNESNKKAILYGNSATEANIPFMILKQMGVKNISFLSVGYEELKTGNWNEIAANTTKFNDENPVADFAQFISDANKSSGNVNTTVAKPTISKTKVIVKPAKAAAASADEGC